jgi:hypothetical protein
MPHGHPEVNLKLIWCPAQTKSSTLYASMQGIGLCVCPPLVQKNHISGHSTPHKQNQPVQPELEPVHVICKSQHFMRYCCDLSNSSFIV